MWNSINSFSLQYEPFKPLAVPGSTVSLWNAVCMHYQFNWFSQHKEQPVKLNTAAILREGARVQRLEQEEEKSVMVEFTHMKKHEHENTKTTTCAAGHSLSLHICSTIACAMVDIHTLCSMGLTLVLTDLSVFAHENCNCSACFSLSCVEKVAHFEIL